jgi:endonuclease/exonuclease/phosphatase family metal-dependent hydrolase
MTYNIRAGLGFGSARTESDMGTRLGEIADVIRAADADVVLLQEVDQGVQRTGEIDEPAVLADLLEMNHAFAPAIELQGGRYGVALLTRWEIASQSVHLLFQPNLSETHPDLPDYFSEQRVAQIAQLVSGELTLTVVNTHLGLTKEQRTQQLGEIAEFLAQMDALSPLVLGGDLNCEPDSSELAPIRRLLRDAYQDFRDDRGLLLDMPIADRLTFPADEPVRCIDYLFVQSASLDVVETEVVETAASDHRPVFSRLRFVDAPVSD